MLIIRHEEVRDILDGRESELINVVAAAYQTYDEGSCAVPHSAFLRFPGDNRNRIIALPAFLGGDTAVAGVKWISSFPRNVDSGLERASAAILLNSLETGHPQTLIEGSLISAKRTAASAALAGGLFLERPTDVAMIGCGVINREILKFLNAAHPRLEHVTVHDVRLPRAGEFARWVRELMPNVDVDVAVDVSTAMAGHSLVSIATTASEPYMNLDSLRPGGVALHVSLRDIYPETVLANHNVVDDADHVCRERTSLDLCERITGRRSFVNATIGQVLNGTAAFVRDPEKRLIFSPFGLGMLDMALAEYVRAAAVRRGLGVHVDGFLPTGLPVPLAS